MFWSYQGDFFHVITEDFWHCPCRETDYSQSKLDTGATGIPEMSESFACCSVPGWAFSRIGHCHFSYVALVVFLLLIIKSKVKNPRHLCWVENNYWLSSSNLFIFFHHTSVTRQKSCNKHREADFSTSKNAA